MLDSFQVDLGEYKLSAHCNEALADESAGQKRRGVPAEAGDDRVVNFLRKFSDHGLFCRVYVCVGVWETTNYVSRSEMTLVFKIRPRGWILDILDSFPANSEMFECVPVCSRMVAFCRRKSTISSRINMTVASSDS